MPVRKPKRAALNNSGPSRRRRLKKSSSPDGSSMVFFSIMLPSVMEKKKLKLPVKFVRRYGRQLGGNMAQLHLPNGSVWNVGVSSGRGTRIQDICLDQGWASFMDKNSVLLHYFLTFKYVGESIFHVRIYDLSTCEIPYPPIHDPTDNGGESSVIYLGSTKSEDNDDDDNGVDDALDSHGEEEWGPILNGLEAREIYLSCKFSCTFRKLSEASKKALSEAIRNKLEDGPSFVAVIMSRGRHNLNVPTGFVKQNMTGDGEAVILKEVAGGGKWVVEASFGSDGMFRLLGEEWQRFYRENNLETGDVCLFQLMPKEKVEFLVSIYRASPFRG
ncbi:unnamed protein product [Linum trigynum]|uniref:TF-B3 domain-containing protein n=1 Tax=Linum trigynum TaxID=586398 RepID=A0AAV2ETM5_9ROSI